MSRKRKHDTPSDEPARQWGDGVPSALLATLPVPRPRDRPIHRPDLQYVSADAADAVRSQLQHTAALPAVLTALVMQYFTVRLRAVACRLPLE
jgi:hypothetical protein